MTTGPAPGITALRPPASPGPAVPAMPRALIALFTLTLAVAALRADDRPAREKARDLERHLRQVIDDAEASVVAVSVSHSPRYAGRIDPANPGKLGEFLNPRLGGGPGFDRGAGFDAKLDLADLANVADHPFGTGVVLDADGLILTNYHLVEGARKIYVRGPGGRGQYADIHAADARSDLAVLKLLRPLADLRPMPIAPVRVATGPNGEKPTVARGMWVIALGHPAAAGFADGVPSASWGILSGVRRRALVGSAESASSKPLSQLSALLQTDARLTLGSSGSPLLNLDGEMIGLSTPAAAVTGAETAGGFAVPMDQNFRRIVATLKEGREVEYGFLGVSLAQPAPGARLLDNGLPIIGVSPGSPAERAGLAGGFPGRRGMGEVAGDSILAVDGQPLREQDDLFLLVGAALAGNPVRLTVLGPQGQRRTVDVPLTKSPYEVPFIASVRPPAVHGLRVDWGSAATMKIPGVALPECVSVREIEPNGAAARKLREFDTDLKGTWLVLSVDNQTAATPARFAALAAGKRSVTLRMRNLAEPDRDRDVTLP